MMGTYRGRLAVSLDRLTNAMVLVGQHGVYCHSNRDPEKPTMDIQLITQELRKAKELIQSVMEELRAQRENQKPIRYLMRLLWEQFFRFFEIAARLYYLGGDSSLPIRPLPAGL